MNDTKKHVTEYFYSDNSGDAQATVYHLFPGVEVAYTSVHMTDFDFGSFESGKKRNHIEIHYCRDGRIEQEMNREFFYLMPGDCSIALQDQTQTVFQLPLKHYHGIHIGIDLDMAQNPLFDYLSHCECPPRETMKHICGEMSHVVLRSSEAAKIFFEDLYAIKPAQRLDYLRAKLPELFFRMKYADPNSHSYDRSLVPRAQVDFVKDVAHYISQNINEKITVKQLTREFGISDTYLQNSFRSVYGMPVIRFIRVQKMQNAAQLLIHTTRSIDEIAESFGYENESKFSAAFKKIMGDTPNIYRKEHAKIKII